jgi:hypothetical protein
VTPFRGHFVGTRSARCLASQNFDRRRDGVLQHRYSAYPAHIGLLSPSHIRKTFVWDGWVAHNLRLDFLARGLQCPEKLLSTCCAQLVLIPQTIQRRPIAGGRGFGSAPLSKEGTFALLGANPYHRMMQTCQTVFHVPPFPAPQSAKEAYANLLETFKSVVPRKDPV